MKTDTEKKAIEHRSLEKAARKPGGFATMDPEKHRAIAKKGGQSVRPEQRSFSQSIELAAAAGRKGGKSVPPERRSFSLNKSLASSAGRKGGKSVGNDKRSFSTDPLLAARAGSLGGKRTQERLAEIRAALPNRLWK